MKSLGAVRAALDDVLRQSRAPCTAGGQLATVLELLEREPASVTSVRDPLEAVQRHVADSLDGLLVPELRAAKRLADLGAGGGFPGLVLAAALPELRVALVESHARKCAFLRRAVDAAGLSGVDVVCARAEEWPDGLGACDVVTARALAPLAVLVEYAAPLLRRDGVLVSWKARVDAAELADGEAAAVQVGLEPGVPLELPSRPGASARALHVFTKVADTPPRFPRRPGMARKRPLGR